MDLDSGHQIIIEGSFLNYQFMEGHHINQY